MQRIAKTRAAARLLRRAWRPIARQGWWHWVRFAALLTAGSWLGHVLGHSDRFSDIRYALYQKQMRWEHRERIYPQHTVLVLLDDDDYWSGEYQARTPYKRDKLAALLDKLNRAGANIVALDIDFSSPLPARPDFDFPDYAAEDASLYAAFRRMCDQGRHVVLIDVLDGDEHPPYRRTPAIYRQWLPNLPCVSVGHDFLPTDMRKIPGMLRLENGSFMDSLSLAIVRIADPVAYQRVARNQDRGFHFARYLTPADFGPQAGRSALYNGKAIERMSEFDLRQALADRIVIVGGDYSSRAYREGDPVDQHNSPGGYEPGAMLHANYVEALLNQDSTFTPISDTLAAVLEWLLAMALAIVNALDLPLFWKRASVAIAFFFSLLLSYILMQNLGLFLDFLVPFLIIVIHAITEEVLHMRHELHHANQLLKERHG